MNAQSEYDSDYDTSFLRDEYDCLSGLLLIKEEDFLKIGNLSTHCIGYILSTIHVLCLLVSPCAVTSEVTQPAGQIARAKFARFSSTFFCQF